MNEPLSQALSQADTIRFLCSGNMVRSAYAELYARHTGCTLPVDSAGTTYRNHGLYPETRTALTSLGVSSEVCDAFRSRHLDDMPTDPPGRRVVFGMTPDHLDAYRSRHGDRDALFLLGELTGTGRPIADPVVDGVPFDKAFDAVARGVDELVRTVREGLRSE